MEAIKFAVATLLIKIPKTMQNNPQLAENMTMINKNLKKNIGSGLNPIK